MKLLLLLMERCLLSHPGMLLRLHVIDLLLGVWLSTIRHIRHIRVHALPSQILLLLPL